jgi:hypothetical protein
MERPWFKAKKYGWGWYPATWEGWAVTLLWTIAFIRVLALFAERMVAGEVSSLAWFLPLIVVLVGALLLTCWATGEPARWRWGEKE